MRNIFLPCPTTGRRGWDEAASASVWIMGTGNGNKEQGWERGPGWMGAWSELGGSGHMESRRAKAYK